jgi:hypothetical protein
LLRRFASRNDEAELGSGFRRVMPVWPERVGPLSGAKSDSTRSGSLDKQKMQAPVRTEEAIEETISRFLHRVTKSVLVVFAGEQVPQLGNERCQQRLVWKLRISTGNQRTDRLIKPVIFHHDDEYTIEIPAVVAVVIAGQGDRGALGCTGYGQRCALSKFFKEQFHRQLPFRSVAKMPRFEKWMGAAMLY